MNRFSKEKLTLRQLLIGREYYDALIMMEFAMKYHTGTRKDGVTPEFSHQIQIALYAMTLPNIMYPEELITTIFGHDIREDYSITDAEIRALFSGAVFADRVARAVENMTKEWRGVKRDEVKLFEAMAEDPIASIAKGCDRIHNLGSMIRVFTLEKQKSYIKEAKDLFFPMLKTARRNFPSQTAAYENIKHMLLTQIELIEAMHEATEAGNS